MISLTPKTLIRSVSNSFSFIRAYIRICISVKKMVEYYIYISSILFVETGYDAFSRGRKNLVIGLDRVVGGREVAIRLYL